MSGCVDFVLCGFGNIGGQIASMLANDASHDLSLVAIAARNKEKAAAKARELGLDVPMIDAADAPRHANVVVEATTYESFRTVVEPSVEAGCHIVAVSVGALAENFDLLDRARETGATLHIANGTLPGLDMVRAARETGLRDVRLISRLPPRSLAAEPYVTERGFDFQNAADAPVEVFSGSAREAALHFPRHFNIAVSLSLAGIGLDRTMIEIIADGNVPGSRQLLIVKSDAVELEMSSQNWPSPENNRTSRIVAPTIMAALRSLASPVRVGS